ncbi:thioredoxin family protein [Natronocella acetinitrilica]|uniref:thioredoxin family protein n=1 Tax=Natronocella acetinitrilica TaxID=414046 RepID=UPI00209D1521|nr:thioredoxin family protein [Natronocella acetinitrilica]
MSREKVNRYTRRGFLTMLALAVPGMWIGMEWNARQAQADVSMLGSGRPVIVQIHDPGCPHCRRLRRNVESVYPEFQEAMEWRIMDINTGDGRGFARQHGVSHMTLLLFDGDGDMYEVLEGVRSEDELRTAFRRLQRDG